jgi:hypothetical protein
MQVVCESDYQDIYRIKDGVLLVVNKFKPIDYSDKTDRWVHIQSSSVKWGKYKKECQDHLKILKKDHYDKWANITIPKGTVLYCSRPVELITDPAKFEYQIKTTGEMFSGDSEMILDYINDIVNVVKRNA